MDISKSEVLSKRYLFDGTRAHQLIKSCYMSQEHIKMAQSAYCKH
jgi:hypothetical protein